MPAGESQKTRFPGLLPAEVQLWREWLVDHELEYDSFEYNVHVGPGVDAPPEALEDLPELREKLTEQFRRATQHRIDVVARQGPAVTLIEVKEKGTVTALGQLISYGEMWVQQHPPTAPLFLRLVARDLSPGMSDVFNLHGVKVDLLG